MKKEKLTIKKIQEGLKRKDFSAVEIAKKYLKVIQEKDKKLHAFLEVSESMALKQAQEVDEKIAQKEKIAPLAGVPCSVKDAIMVKGLKCTAGSKMLENYKAVYSATSVEKIIEQGALILGKTNLDEFAMGSSTEHSYFGATKNPWDLTRVPGGTSGGSAASVSAEESVFSLGSDTGGSIRQPASFCGVVGLKPTYGAVSRYGLIAHGSSLEQIGAIANNVEDCQTIFNTIKGKDEKDATSVEYKSSKFKVQSSKFKEKNIIIGIPKEYFGEGLDEEVKRSVLKAVKGLEEQGCQVEEVSLPHSKYALACYYIISTSEASANLAKYDGLRYGTKVQSSKLKVKSLLENYIAARSEGFSSEVKRRIILGTFCLSSGYYDAYYQKAQKVRELIKQDFALAFEKVDLLLTPTSPFCAFKLGEKLDNPLQMYLADIYTVSINLAGLPALSLPCGLNKEGLPIGLQIIGPHFTENKIFELAKKAEITLEK
ncbi:Asp-tRNA(Asn)/Glu-tRNA(Gln) amidotransferase subunit GatA [Candidatus Parcubacteria bacterium]|nr:Asp-tRNA(Asn)/Glu-tRNA(Gln) amidotransferase subunit GatA [Candidatus Parcubacteria bacterium]